jgi:hypothetical protein
MLMIILLPWSALVFYTWRCNAHRVYKAVQIAGMAISARNVSSFFHDLACLVVDAAGIRVIGR